MRKPRDFDAELKALDDKAKKLRQRKVVQLGELVIATGADALPIELLAGVLLTASDSPNMVAKEEWRARGAAFFRRTSRKDSSGARRHSLSGEAHHSGPPSPSGEAGTS